MFSVLGSITVASFAKASPSFDVNWLWYCETVLGVERAQIASRVLSLASDRDNRG